MASSVQASDVGYLGYDGAEVAPIMRAHAVTKPTTPLLAAKYLRGQGYNSGMKFYQESDPNITYAYAAEDAVAATTQGFAAPVLVSGTPIEVRAALDASSAAFQAVKSQSQLLQKIDGEFVIAVERFFARDSTYGLTGIAPGLASTTAGNPGGDPSIEGFISLRGTMSRLAKDETTQYFAVINGATRDKLALEARLSGSGLSANSDNTIAKRWRKLAYEHNLDNNDLSYWTTVNDNLHFIVCRDPDEIPTDGGGDYQNMILLPPARIFDELGISISAQQRELRPAFACIQDADAVRALRHGGDPGSIRDLPTQAGMLSISPRGRDGVNRTVWDARLMSVMIVTSPDGLGIYENN